MEHLKALTVQQLYDYAREHNMEHARIRFLHDSYTDAIDAQIQSSILYPDQQFIILS